MVEGMTVAESEGGCYEMSGVNEAMIQVEWGLDNYVSRHALESRAI
jgi:hypothetical protein